MPVKSLKFASWILVLINASRFGYERANFCNPVDPFNLLFFAFWVQNYGFFAEIYGGFSSY
ncbi:MAG: hypothetical protein D6687_08110 [Acidobacteria bacterium]|nr:MAG: hypothetical protein D6687_08110 [Acidobacteriota bacterium]